MKRERLEQLPPQWASAAKRTVAALARAERNAAQRLRGAVRGPVDAALARLAVLPSNASREVVARVVQQTSPGLAVSMASAVELVRLAGRTSGSARLQEEWSLARGLINKALGPQTFADLSISGTLSATDQARAQAAGQGYASAWTTAAIAALMVTGEKTPAKRLDDATRGIDYRVLRIAATENAQAFNEARDEGMGWIAEHHGEARWFAALLKRWDATLDRKVCSVCAGLDGTITLWGLPFPNGQKPGHVHPNDRCIEGVVFLPARIRGETIPGRQVDDERPRDAA